MSLHGIEKAGKHWLCRLGTCMWQICDEPLHSIRAHDQGFLLATGSDGGTTTLLELSSALSTLQRNEKSVITAVR